ncbi:TetR/AcrR family transcriptional regulator [Actinomadura yumaensis]|uniref:TetR/AcrR family transcriptional regulator n=1 Tax=Actinomadura yumaensis TaxID=111807 RepID=A0ABW2CJW6_9ACTN
METEPGDAEQISIWMRPERPARGPRPAYSRDQIVEAAVRIADADGLEAASMRRIAAEIGTGAMSIYRYVPSRQDLVDLMHDRVLGELDLPDRPSGDWRADLTLVAERSLALSRRHPWLVRLMRARPAFGPNELRLLEFQLGALDVGIPIDEMMVLAGVLNGYVESVARSRVAFTEEARRTGLTMEEWMRRSIPYVKRLLADGDHPLFARVITHARQPHMDDEQQFRYGLDRVLDCIAAALPTDPRPPAHARARARAQPSGGGASDAESSADPDSEPGRSGNPGAKLDV